MAGLGEKGDGKGSLPGHDHGHDHEAGIKEEPQHGHHETINNEHLSPVLCPPSTSERALIKKLDLHIIPFLCILYLLAFLDRVNIANARSFSLANDLQINTNSLHFNTALTIFFVPYILFEIPSNLLLKKLSPRLWLSACMVMFGFVTICQGLVQSYGGLLTTRFLLGLFESGMFPGSVYVIGMWYRRSEAQRRYSIFFSSSILAGIIAGLLASAIGKMDGLRGYHGWRWIFILEGLLTCLVAAGLFFFIPSFPEDAKWLTAEERDYVRARLQVDQGQSAADRRITARDVLRVFADYKIFLGGLMLFGLTIPAYGYAYFAPTIIGAYGYSPIKTQLYSVPPWVCAFVFTILVAFASDRLQHRFLFALLSICVSISGFAILLSVHNNLSLQYFALFLVVIGAYSAMPVIVCWFNMNLGGHRRRAVGTAYQIAFGNIGGIIATYTFIESDAVNFFHMGYSICLGSITLGAFSCCLYAWAITSQNRQRDRMPKNENLTENEKAELGDLSPDYRYLL